MTAKSRDSSRSMARDISYAHSARTRGGAAFIRTFENLTGRPGLIRKAGNYQEKVAQGEDFWDVMAETYNLKLDVVSGALENIPADGPVIVIANHPYGILDGLVLGHILASRRGEFRILAHRVFSKAKNLETVILPVDFEGTRESIRQNLSTRRDALHYLGDGGAIGIFPGGTVSTAPRPFGEARDPRWRTFTAKLIAKTDAAVVPIFFDGANSRLFQVASHVNYTLRMALLISEFRRGVKNDVRIAIGQPIDRADLRAYSSDPRAMMDFLRESTYGLSPKPASDISYGFEFEKIHR